MLQMSTDVLLGSSQNKVNSSLQSKKFLDLGKLSFALRAAIGGVKWAI